MLANKKRISSANIVELEKNEIFVFGSNLEGQHTGGAANIAHKKFFAQWGVGIGMTGNCYAIPTMQGGIETIKPYVDRFIDYAKHTPELDFLVTEIGCGIAGFRVEDIAPLFFKAIKENISNIYLPETFYHQYELLNNM